MRGSGTCREPTLPIYSIPFPLSSASHHPRASVAPPISAVTFVGEMLENSRFTSRCFHPVRDMLSCMVSPPPSRPPSPASTPGGYPRCVYCAGAAPQNFFATNRRRKTTKHRVWTRPGLFEDRRPWPLIAEVLKEQKE